LNPIAQNVFHGWQIEFITNATGKKGVSMPKNRRHRFTAHLSDGAFQQLGKEAIDSGRSRSDVLNDLIMRGPLLEAIRAIIREELGK
jgi:hypothetical protein